MTENKRFQIIHLGNPYDFVVKDHQDNAIYGTLQGDDKSLQECLDKIAYENEQLKQRIRELEKENKELKSINQKQAESRRKITKILENGGVILTRKQLLEVTKK